MEALVQCWEEYQW